MSKWLSAAASLAVSLAVLHGPATAQDVPALAKAKDAQDRARIQTLIDGAAKEGTFEWISAAILPQNGEKISEAFKTYYGLKDLKVQFTYTSTAQLVSRVEQLLKARSNNFDVVWTTTWPWYHDLLRRGDIAEYDSPLYAEYTLSNKAGLSKKGYWTADAYAMVPMYNAAAVAKRGVKDFHPTSWKDFADPRLKGMVSVGNVLSSQTSPPTYLGVNKTVGSSWFKDLLTNTRPVSNQVAAQGRDWLASGEFPIQISAMTRDGYDLKTRNIDVKMVFPKEGVVLLPFAPIIMKSAPHPNGAKLFIDFVRSADGAQAVMDSGALLFFGRPGVKSPDAQIQPRWEDVKVIPYNWESPDLADNVSDIREIFRAAGVGR